MKNIYLIILFLAALSGPACAQEMTIDDIIAYRAEQQAGYAQQDAYEAMDQQATTAYQVQRQGQEIKELRERLDHPDIPSRHSYHDVITEY